MSQKRHNRLQRFADSGAVGVYPADDLHNDVRWILNAYQELRGALAVVATWEPSTDPDPWQEVSAKAAAFHGMQNLAVATLEKIDKFNPA